MDRSDTQPLQRTLVDKSDAEPLRPPGFIKLGAPLPIRIPTRPEEITMEWLTDAFRFKGYLMRDGRVVSLNMQAIGEGQGAFGDLVLVTVTFEGGRLNAPTTFVAKFAPVCTGRLKRLETRVIFLNEAHFYNDLAVQLGPELDPSADQADLAHVLIEDYSSETSVRGLFAVGDRTPLLCL